MAEQKLLFKRGTKANLESILVGAAKPLAGEPVYETDSGKLKIGNGINDYKDLPYLSGGSGSDSIYIEGYFLNGKFYTDSTYQTECEKNNQKIYINKNARGQAQAENFIDIYRYCGDSTGYLPLISIADDIKPGLIKLYKESGQHEDGTMTQKVITNGVKDIKFAVDSTEDECLILDLPW